MIRNIKHKIVNAKQLEHPKDISSFLKFVLFLTYIVYTFQNIGLILPQIKPYYVLFTVTIIVTLCHILLKGNLLFLKKAIDFYWVFILFSLWSLASIVWSIESGQSIQHAIKFLLFCAFAISITTVFGRRHSECIRTIIFALAANFIITAIGFIYTFLINGGFGVLSMGNMSAYVDFMSDVTFGFAGGKNLLSSWAAFELTLAVPLLRKYCDNKLLSNIIAILSLIVLCLTISRIAIYCVSMFLFIAFFKLDMAIKLRVIMVTFITAIALFSFAQINDPKFTEKYYDRIASPIEALLDNKTTMRELNNPDFDAYDVDRGVYGRIVLWKMASESLKKHSIWFGTGAGTVYGKGIDNEDNYHNQPLQFLVQLGIPGLLLFLIWNIKVFFRQLKLHKYLEGKDKFLAWILAANMIVYSVKGLFMAQYLDLEIWTIILLTSLLYVNSYQTRIDDE